MRERREVWVGTQGGVFHFCAEVAGGPWRRRGPALAGEDVASLARHPDGTLLAGTHAGTIFRADGGGTCWRQLLFDNKQAELNAHYAACTAAGVPVTTSFGPGEHDWAYWDDRIQDVLSWLPLAGG